ncbi:hypothetical protein MKA38_09080 [[Clostridium] innocuum]|nr:hypothetical protein [[Clostridium] innocuum]
MSGDNERLIEIYDYYGDVIDTIPFNKFSVSKTIGAFISKVCMILIGLEIAILMMAGIGIISGYDKILIFVIIVVQIILIYRALQRYYDDTVFYRWEKALYILNEKRICSLSRSIGIMIILNISILMFNSSVHNLDLQEFKTQIRVSEKTKDAQIEDMTIKVIAGESSPSYEYKVCHDHNCGTHVSKENIIADKYDVEQITTTVITPDKIKKEMISYQLIFLKDRPIVDTFQSKDDFYKQAYAQYRFSHMIENIILGIVIFLEGLCFTVLVFYIKKYKGQEDISPSASISTRRKQ